LAVNQKVAASTQRQALNAIIFLYKKVLDIPVDEKLESARTKRHPRPPVVMTQKEVANVLANIRGRHLLMAKLLYGSGLRLVECVRLRVRDLDFERRLIYVRAAKGDKDRTALFPESLHLPMKRQLKAVERLHQQDLEHGYGEVYLPKCPCPQIPPCRQILGLTICVPLKKPQHRSSFR
jgi:integrase